jgi:hypothetical protein
MVFVSIEEHKKQQIDHPPQSIFDKIKIEIKPFVVVHRFNKTDIGAVQNNLEEYRSDDIYEQIFFDLMKIHDLTLMSSGLIK